MEIWETLNFQLKPPGENGREGIREVETKMEVDQEG